MNQIVIRSFLDYMDRNGLRLDDVPAEKVASHNSRAFNVLVKLSNAASLLKSMRKAKPSGLTSRLSKAKKAVKPIQEAAKKRSFENLVQKARASGAESGKVMSDYLRRMRRATS